MPKKETLEETIAEIFAKGLGSALGLRQCLKCNHWNPREASYCGSCGAKMDLVKRCPNCGRIYSYLETVKYCHNCGNKLVEG